MVDKGSSAELEDGRAIEEIISAGSDIAGGVSGAAIGLLVAGPPGALGGAVAGPLVTRTFRRVAVEIKQRLLGPREEARIAIALEASATKIQENVDQGKAVRRDDLFQETPGSRSAAEEIAEGTLLAAQREYEERKVPYQGRLLGNILFHPEINQAEANHLIRLAQDLS